MLESTTMNRADLFRGASWASVRLYQAKFVGVFGTEEKIQVTVLAGIPVRPPMGPVRSSKIASVVTEDLHGAQGARLIPRIENELRAAFRPGARLL
jgi:hypothetical protein